MDETEAIQACQRGDASAFRALFDLHVGHVYRVAFLIVRDQERAEDIAQQTFLILFQRLASLDAGPLHSWLGRVAANLGLNDRRRAWELPFDSLSAAQRERAEAWGATAATDELLEAAEQRDAIRRAVVTLPPRQRAIVVLRYFGDCSLAEIGEALGCRPGTVRATLHQAIKRLRATSRTNDDEFRLRPCGGPPIPERGDPEYEA
jgi:RNA polymerase sigma-70 factor (ECF subfamily)